jgi:hypothetical protein
MTADRKEAGDLRHYPPLIVALLIAVAISVMWLRSPWPVTVFQITGFALAAALIARWWIGRATLGNDRLLIPLAAMALWPFVQLACGTTVYAWRTAQADLYWTTCLVWFFIALQLCSDPRRTALFLRALAFFSYGVALLSPLQRFTAPGRVFWIFALPHGSSMGPFLYVNQYAGFIELFLPISLYALLTDIRFRLWHVGGAALLYTSVIGAASRAGFVVSTAIIVVTVWMLYSRSVAAPRRILGVLSRTAIVAAVLIAAIGPATLVRKFSASDPYSVRREYLRSTVAMIRQRPVLGVGMGNWATVYPGLARFDDGQYVSQARNDWAQWTAEGGIPFLAMMVWFAWGTLKNAHRTIWALGLVAIFLHSWVDYLIDRTALAMLFFSLAGAAAAARKAPEWD